MELRKLAVLAAVALSLAGVRAEDSKVEVKVDDDGVKAETRLDTDKETPRKKGVFSKSDGKILGLFPAPSARKNKAEIEVDADKNRVEVDADVDRDHEVFRKGDGKVLGIETDRNRDGVKVETDVDVDRDGNKVFRKGDGKVLGIETDRDRDGVKLEADVDVDRDGNKVFRKGDGKVLGIDVDRDRDRDGLKVEADADLDTDKNDGKTLGVDVDRNRTRDGVKLEADVDVDDDGVKKDSALNDREGLVVREDTPGARNKITTAADGGLDTDKGDGRVLGLPKRGFETMSLANVPAAVRRTIQVHAKGSKIAELELGTKDGQRVYEVEIQREGRNQELLIAPDGRLLWDTHAATGNAPRVQTETKVEVDDTKIEIEKK